MAAEPSIAAALRVENLEAWRGDRQLFSALSFEIGAGQTLHVSGQNGSGKTTLLRILCGLRSPHEGTVRWKGRPIDRDPGLFHAELAFLGHHDGIKLELTALENATALCALRGGNYVSDPETALIRVGLADMMDLPARSLSAGQRRRVALASLLTREIALWILDEPFTALDSEGVGLMGQIIEEHRAAGGCVILTSHQELLPELGRPVVLQL